MPHSLRKIIVMFLLCLPVLMHSQADCVVDMDLHGDDTLCVGGAPFPLPPGTPAGGVYSGINVIDGVFKPEGLTVGVYEVYYTFDDGTCIGIDTGYISIVEPQPLEFIGDMSLCGGGTTNLYSPNGELYIWESGDTSNTAHFTPTSDTTSYATGPDASGCTVTTYFTITVSEGAIPEGIVVEDYYPICAGDAVTLSVGDVGTWTWFDNSSGSTVDVNPAVDTEYTLTINGTGSCDTTIYILVDVFDLPTLSLTGDQIVCFGDTATIYATGGVTYKTQFGPFDGVLQVTPEVNTTYVIRSFNEIECEVSQNYTVFVNDNPILTLEGDSVICSGDTVFFIATGAPVYSWLNADTGQEIFNETTGFVMVQPEVTTNYSVIGTAGSGCDTELEYQVIVNPLPALAIEPLTPFCDGELISLLASGADTLLWSNGFTDTLYEFIGTEDIQFELFGKTTFGCTDSILFDVEIHPVPVVGVIGIGNICFGQSTALTATGADFYDWEGNFSGAVNIISPSADTSLMVVGTTVFGCVDFTNYNVIVREVPEIQLTGDNEICIGDTIQLTITTNGSITWNNDLEGLVVNVSPTADSTFLAVATAENGCTTPASLDVIVHPLPIVAIESGNEICYGESITLIASGASSYLWNTGSENDTLTLTPVTNSIFKVIGTDIYGCIDQAGQEVAVHPTPYVFFEFSEDSICDLGPALSWIANPAGGVMSGDGVSGNWFFPGDALVGDNEVTYTFVNEFNCSSSASDVINIDDCTGINEVNNEQISIYPNPASDFIRILNSGIGVKQMTIINAHGEVVLKNNQPNAREIEIGSLSNGVYHLEFLLQDGGRRVERFVKM